MNGTVRRAGEKDIPAILKLLVQVNKVHYDERPDLFNETTKYNEEELGVIVADDRTPVFVFEDEDGNVLGHGFCELQRPANTALLKDNLTLYIDDICVDANARGKHVGQAICRHILEFAREKGCYNVTLNVWTCNPGARQFYDSLGFEPYKTGMEMIL